MNNEGIEQRIIERARAEGAALVGIARIADLKNAPSYAAYDANPFYPEYEGVEWKEEYKSVLVWGLPHPVAEPVLDWWSMKVKGFTPGNRELAAQSKRLRVWLNEELGVGALSLPYQIEYGGAFLKDSAVLAGLGVIGRNNLLVTPQFGPRIRLRGIFLEAELEPTGPLADFDPCGACDEPCRSACPKDAYGSGTFARALCKQEQDQRDVDFEVFDGALLGIDEPSNVTAYCRACELACPVAPDYAPEDAPAREPAVAQADQTHFVLPDDRLLAFTGLLGGKSRPIPALSEAAAAASPLGEEEPLQLVALDGTHDTLGFDCGETVLDDYLVVRAEAEERTGKTRVVARDGRVVAFFGLKAASVSPQPDTQVPAMGKGPRDVPAILLARLAVDASAQGHGLGEALLVQALSRCLQASSTMFARAVLAVAPTEQARGFYEKYGFEPSPTDPHHLVMRMKDIRKSLVQAEQ
jgi:epoxyqueuosine reductase